MPFISSQDSGSVADRRHLSDLARSSLVHRQLVKTVRCFAHQAVLIRTKRFNETECSRWSCNQTVFRFDNRGGNASSAYTVTGTRSTVRANSGTPERGQ